MQNYSRKVLLIAVVLAFWIASVIASGAGWNPFSVSWSFTNTGAFGDSFGPIGAIMAALAAFAAFEALSEQRKEIERVQQREMAEDRRREAADNERRKQEARKDLFDRRSSFEGTFFNLLESLREIVRETDLGIGDSRKTSRDAFARMCVNLANYRKNKGSLDLAWQHLISLHKNDLSHYFRFLYHIVKYIDEQKGLDRQLYIRFLRATLSEPELVLLFANCAVGEGIEKFSHFVSKYHLLHNTSNDAQGFWEMRAYLPESAFNSVN